MAIRKLVQCRDAAVPLPWRREYRKCGIRGGRTQGLWARGRASQVLTGKKLAGPDWAELWQRHLRVQPALGMESPVAAAGARGTEAVAGEGPVIGGASQGSAVSVPKGVARWKLLRQVRATARHLWPPPSQVPGARTAAQPRDATSHFVGSQSRSVHLLHPLSHRKREDLAGLAASGTFLAEVPETQIEADSFCLPA